MKIKNFLFCLVCVIILFSDVKKTNALSELNINDNDIDISSGQLIAEDTKYFATVTFYNKNILCLYYKFNKYDIIKHYIFILTIKTKEK